LRRPAGCQYVCWSDDSSRLAASSDTLNAVAVWALRYKEEVVPLARLDAFEHEILALSFVPSEAGAHTLAFVEKVSCLYAVDVDAAGAADAWARPLSAAWGGAFMRSRGVQRTLLQPPDPAKGRITGLAIAPCGLFAAVEARLFEFRPLTSWSPQQHSLFPARFQAAVMTLLLCNRRQQDPDGLSALPIDVVLQIIKLAAAPQSCWLLPRPDELTEREMLAHDDDESGWITDD
jgi:hypothetical protein